MTRLFRQGRRAALVFLPLLTGLAISATSFAETRAQEGGAAPQPEGPPYVHEDRLEVHGNYASSNVSPVLAERFAALAKCYAASLKVERHRQVTIGLTFMITRRGSMSRLEGAGGEGPPRSSQAQELACTVESFAGMTFTPPPEMVRVEASITVSNDRA